MTLISRTLLAASVALVPCLGGCDGSEPRDESGVTIGLLLPFTGTSSATTSNFERALIYAADRANDSGGVKGRRLRIVARDTHSDLERGRESAEALVDAGAEIVIGPESAEIAADITPLLHERGVSFLSPLVGAADDALVDCTEPWFRLAPSALSLGEALAKQLSAESVTTAALLYAAGPYNEALRAAVQNRFTALGGAVPLTLELDPDAQSYADVIGRTLAEDVEAVVLASSPRTAALIVNEFAATSQRRPRWFLSPLLKTDLLLANVAPEALEGAIGVAPRIFDTSSDFQNAFAERWQRDEPLEGAYFYYDALGLIALAMENTELEPDGTFDRGALDAAILAAAQPPGEAVGWNEIERGLERARAGRDVYYSGLTGPILFRSCGPRRLGATSTWEVRRGAIVNRIE